MSKAIAPVYRDVSYDVATGEVLSGGNTFVHVAWAEETLKTAVETFGRPFISSIRNLEVGACHCLSGTSYVIRRVGPSEFRVVRLGDNYTVTSAYGVDIALKALAPYVSGGE